MTVRNLDVKNALLGIFIITSVGCSPAIEQDAAESTRVEAVEQTAVVDPTERKADDLNEELMTIPVASIESDGSQAADAEERARLPLGDFTTSDIKETFPSGETRTVYQVRTYGDEQIRHGEYQEFYEDGTPFAKGEFHNDIRHGTWQYFHSDGQPARVAEYEFGVPSGEWKWFGDDGSLFRVANYVGGIKSGPQVTYWPDGTTVKLNENFVDGKQHGQLSGFNDAGNRVLELSFRDGKPHGSETRWFATGVVAVTGSYENGRPHGLFTYYDVEGTKTSEVHWTNGQRTPGFTPNITTTDE